MNHVTKINIDLASWIQETLRFSPFMFHKFQPEGSKDATQE